MFCQLERASDSEHMLQVRALAPLSWRPSILDMLGYAYGMDGKVVFEGECARAYPNCVESANLSYSLVQCSHAQ